MRARLILLKAILLASSLLLSADANAQGLENLHISRANFLKLEADAPQGGRKVYNGMTVVIKVPLETKPIDMITYGESYFDPKLKELTKVMGHDIFIIAFVVGEQQVGDKRVEIMYRVSFTREGEGDWVRATKHDPK
jgi:hypothetical protein